MGHGPGDTMTEILKGPLADQPNYITLLVDKHGHPVRLLINDEEFPLSHHVRIDYDMTRASMGVELTLTVRGRLEIREIRPWDLPPEG